MSTAWLASCRLTFGIGTCGGRNFTVNIGRSSVNELPSRFRLADVREVDAVDAVDVVGFRAVRARDRLA